MTYYSPLNARLLMVRVLAEAVTGALRAPAAGGCNDLLRVSSTRRLRYELAIATGDSGLSVVHSAASIS